jgi:hypothetical protein
MKLFLLFLDCDREKRISVISAKGRERNSDSDFGEKR